MYLPAFIIVFIVLTFFMSFIYFYLFTRDDKGRFIRYWGLCWVFYSFSLVFLMLYINNPSILFLGFRKVFDILNIVFLLFGAYAFTRIQIPGYWWRFILYLILWTGMGIFYEFDLLSIFLPSATYQIFATIALCSIVLKHWAVPTFEKALSLCIFLFWGMGKAALSIFELGHFGNYNLYFMEIIFSNIIHFCIFVIYIQKARNEMAFVNRLYRIIADNATDIIFYYTLEPQESFAYITPSVEDLFGYTPNDFYANPKFYLEIVPPNQFDDISGVFNARNEPHRSYTRVFQIIHKNGDLLWAEFNITTLFKDEKPVAVEGIIRDISKMKEIEQELLASRKSRDLLLSYVSHELKTPVTSILGYVNAIKDGTISNKADITEAINIIFQKSLTLEHLIDDLFQLSKLESRQLSFQFMRMSAIEVATKLMDRHILDIKTANLKLAYKIDSKALAEAYIIIDFQRIDQVFSNIISNAIKYTRPGNKLKIDFGLDPKNKSFYTSITDNGVGINQNDLPYIFDRFYKSSNPIEERPTSGTGLGLTIAKEIISAHRGQISVRSKRGKGSTFIFSIPLYLE